MQAESFKGHYLNYATFINVSFHHCDLSEVDAKLATFIDCHFEDCRYDHANFQFTRFQNCVFESSQEKTVLSNISMGASILVDCRFFVGSQVCIKNSSVRDAQFTNSVFGLIDFRDSSIEAADIRKCKFDLIDISYSSASGAILLDNDFETVVFSIPSFFLVIGSWQFLDANHCILSDLANGKIERSLTQKDDITSALTAHLENEIANGTSIWRTSNGLISVSLINSTAEERGIEISEAIASEITCSNLPEEQLIDEISFVLSAFQILGVKSHPVLSAVQDVKGACASVQSKIHPKVWSTFVDHLDCYERSTNELFMLELTFADLDLLADGAIAAAVDFINDFQKEFPKEHCLDQSKLVSGSIVIEFLTAASSIPWWLAMFIVLGIGSKLNINFDVNKMFDQVGNLTKVLSKRMQPDERQSLSDKAEALGMTVIILDQSLVSKMPLAQAIKPSDLTSLMKQVARNNSDGGTC